MERVETLIAELDAAAPAAGADQRERPRIDFCQAMWLNQPLQSGQPWVHVMSRNLSTGGLAFISRRPIPAGSFLIVAHHLNEGSDQLTLCCVRFCRQVDANLFEIGMAFQEARPDPGRLRDIPPAWNSRVLRSQWAARHGAQA